MPIEKIPKGEYQDTLADLKRLLVDNTNKTNELVEEVNRLNNQATAGTPMCPCENCNLNLRK